jgi:hypothetical protein
LERPKGPGALHSLKGTKDVPWVQFYRRNDTGGVCITVWVECPNKAGRGFLEGGMHTDEGFVIACNGGTLRRCRFKTVWSGGLLANLLEVCEFDVVRGKLVRFDVFDTSIGEAQPIIVWVFFAKRYIASLGRNKVADFFELGKEETQGVVRDGVEHLVPRPCFVHADSARAKPYETNVNEANCVEHNGPRGFEPEQGSALEKCVVASGRKITFLHGFTGLFRVPELDVKSSGR